MLAYDWNFLGLSTETKPMTGEKVVDGSTFYECDTSTFFIYYQGEWYQQTFVTEDGINFWLYKTLMKKMFGKLFDSNISKGKVIKPTTGTEIEFTTNQIAQITDLTGYGDTSQQTYSGKNLLPSSGLTPQTYTGGLTITPTYNDNSELLYITANGSYTGDSYFYYHIGNVNFIGGETYTCSGSVGGSGSTYRIWVTGGSAFPSGNRLSSVDGPDTRTASANQKNASVDIQIYPNTTFNNVKFYPQIEKSDTATAYEPYVGGTASPNPDYPQDVQVVTGEQTVTINGEQIYTIDLGTIELCKIGDYQDYIYKSGDDWYVHKECAKSIIDTSTITAYTGYTNIDYALILKPADYIKYNTFQYEPVYFTHAICYLSPSSVGISGWDNTSNIGKSYFSASKTKFHVGFVKGTSLSNIQTSLTGATLYYPIETPTNTKITDTTLISNLNSLLNYIFPEGDHQIIITADDLPMALKLTITEKE